ncbi:hypothetical protein TWF730_000706 [Orbilia blumenaviensis]|uniref:Extracellular membrane protein CFEM domain-containing protein n=1 Tax=Orbilia blumenaviensis TaxID=1796055 RepID=A0AAV9VPM2_9PEZI
MHDLRTWFQHGTVLLSLLLTIPATTIHAQDDISAPNTFTNSAPPQASGVVTIFSDSALASLRPCASTCMEGASIAEWLRCRTPLMDECFCRRGLTSIGRASLFDCAKAGCNGDYEIDGSGLTSVYTRYCNEYLAQLQATGTTENPATNSARTTDGAEVSDGRRTTLQTSRQTTSSVPTNTSAASSSDGGGLGTGGGIGIGIGISALVIAVIGGIWWYLRRKRGRVGPVPDPPKAEEVKPGPFSAVPSVEAAGTPLRELEAGGISLPQTPGELEGGTPPLLPKTPRSMY